MLVICLKQQELLMRHEFRSTTNQNYMHKTESSLKMIILKMYLGKVYGRDFKLHSVIQVSLWITEEKVKEKEILKVIMYWLHF